MGRVAVAVVVALWAVPFSFMVNRIVPEPYMDEVFHVPQAQEYCRFNFRSWNSMITTPPGLYCLSLGHIATIFPGFWWTGAVSSFSELCSAAVLRSINCTLAVICAVLFYDIVVHTRPGLSQGRATLFALVLALYPLHWFFTYLYYTDIASTTAVMAMYLSCLKRSYWLSALLGGIAITIRQTNVIWMLFVACVGTIDYVGLLKGNGPTPSIGSTSSVNKNEELANVKNALVSSNLRKRRKGNFTYAAAGSSLMYGNSSQAPGSGLLDEVHTIICRLWYLKFEILISFLLYLVVLLIFVAFVLWNGGIVLGAKDAHVVSPHFMQILYFGLVSAAAMGSTHFSLGQVLAIYELLSKRKLSSFLVLILGLISVHFFSIAHPYLLADNRHYPFYIWRKIIQVHWLMKYLLVPFYVYSWFSIFNVLGKSQKTICILLYFFACAAVLIPTPLIEFRYYTIPFYFLVFQSPIVDNKSWYIMGLQYVVVNLFTIGMFLFQPFHWDHEPGIQRFMW
ncbi:Dol-P-GlcGlc(2)Man(9)GlcNAc(2)-PP-Dol alpha-1-2-glucosyltransferase [Nymphaea thermarum]|nr:Dol-P-GlcGlc(2)Man(9)GlcNAc(2)-PP-Dol alpha-1-2-glucosyltransferase [Nymphaea thermarum]